MTCQSIQNKIIALPDPRELTAALRDHVVGCGACQAWARQAARLESLLQQLPVPPALGRKKEAMIGDLMQAEPVIHPMATLAQPSSYAVRGVRFLRRNARYVSALAAAVLVVVGIAWYANRPPTVKPEFEMTQDHPLLKKMVARDIAMARADTPAKRLEVLSHMADNLADETRGMARIASPSELKDLERWYKKVVQDGMVKQAETMPIHVLSAVEKRQLYESLATKLGTDATEAEKISREAPQDAQPTLKRMADTARAGEKSLRALAREGK